MLWDKVYGLKNKFLKACMEWQLTERRKEYRGRRGGGGGRGSVCKSVSGKSK